MRKWIAFAATVLVIAAGVYVFREQFRQPSQTLVGHWGAWLLQLDLHRRPTTRPANMQPSSPPAITTQAAPAMKVSASRTDATTSPEDPNNDEEIVKVTEVAEETAADVPALSAESPEPCEAETAAAVVDQTPEPVPVGGSSSKAVPLSPPPSSLQGPSRATPWPHMPYADENRQPPPAEPLTDWLSQFLRELGLTPTCPCPTGGSLHPPAEQHPIPALRDRLAPDAFEESEAPEDLSHSYFRSFMPENAPAPQHVPATGEPAFRTPGAKTPQGLDTLEYRPSDGDEHAYDDLPL